MHARRKKVDGSLYGTNAVFSVTCIIGCPGCFAEHTSKIIMNLTSTHIAYLYNSSLTGKLWLFANRIIQMEHSSDILAERIDRRKHLL